MVTMVFLHIPKDDHDIVTEEDALSRANCIFTIAFRIRAKNKKRTHAKEETPSHDATEENLFCLGWKFPTREACSGLKEVERRDGSFQRACSECVLRDGEVYGSSREKLSMGGAPLSVQVE